MESIKKGWGKDMAISNNVKKTKKNRCLKSTNNDIPIL